MNGAIAIPYYCNTIHKSKSSNEILHSGRTCCNRSDTSEDIGCQKQYNDPMECAAANKCNKNSITALKCNEIVHYFAFSLINVIKPRCLSAWTLINMMKRSRTGPLPRPVALVKKAAGQIQRAQQMPFPAKRAM